MTNHFRVICITPFENPDVNLALFLQKTGAFPVIHLGRSKGKASEALKQMLAKTKEEFGVCFADSSFIDIPLPKQVSLVILPANINPVQFKKVQILHQITNRNEAIKALKSGATGLIVKGNEGAGTVSDKSSFILFQEIKKEINLPIWLQGGMGIHSSAGMIAGGAAGVILDSQLALFPESNVPLHIKEVCKSLEGFETRQVDNFRILVRPNSPKISSDAKFADILPLLGSTNLDKGFIPVGQDICFAYYFVKKYKSLKNFISALIEAINGHLQQAKAYDVLSENNPLAKELKIKYPIAQGPMTRISDIPEFANAVASSGGLPFLALSLLSGTKAKDLLEQTEKVMGDKPWGVGILGFVSQELRKEQLQYIKEIRPAAVLIAGGRPSQAKPLEQIGIKTFIHAPSPALLDIFLKEGAKRFVFEGRECGGHVGPLSSLVLWEKQIERLLEEEEVDQLNILFAGGIHDSLSAAIVSVMSAPLAAKGAKIGVLIGTAYLYTNEAVESGAILKQYQELAIRHSDTVLLDTAPGHVTRCLNTPFVEFFNHEKKRNIEENKDKKEVWQRLEQLNLGRLRIAAKGIERKGEILTKVSSKNQLLEGMYMIGQVTALRNKVVSITELHKDIVSAQSKIICDASIPVYTKSKDQSLNIAIIGMACIYPGARNIEEYWKNIVLGKNCITEVPDDRWNKEIYYDPNSSNGEKTPSKWGGFIPDVLFDPVEYGIPPQSLCSIDPAQLLSLLVAKTALIDAGYDNREFDRENTSVIFGVDSGGSSLASNYRFRMLLPQIFGEIPEELNNSLPKLTEDSFPGILTNIISSRIANRLDLNGRNYTVDAACASSLAAIELACQELYTNKSSMVITGGVDLHNNITDYLLFSSTKALSRNGKGIPFDSESDGLTLGEGVAVVVLKRLEDAKIDGDKIYAVIQGVGASSDGKSMGITAPRKFGQIKALERAYKQAGIIPSEAGLIEAHGTGTVVGDRTELNSLNDLFINSGAIKNQTQLGSVKSQIGHTKCASGIAGLIKVALSVYHSVKPPTLNVTNPNPFYKQETSPFIFNKESSIWPESKRIAGVSAFGFGGTNYHAVIENDNLSSNKNRSSDTDSEESLKVEETNICQKISSSETNKISILKSWPFELLVFRGRDLNEAISRLKQVKTLLTINDSITLKDIAFSLATESNDQVQLLIVAQNAEDLSNKIELALNSSYANGIYQTKKLEGKIAFLFSGQGSQRLNMARDLFVLFPSMLKYLDIAPEYLKILFPDNVFTEEAKKKLSEKIKDTRIAQPLLGIVDYAIACFLTELGIIPDTVAGHSYGEIPALCFANVFNKENLVLLSEKRAEAILKAIGDDNGAMLAVNSSEQELAEILKEYPDLTLANHNSENQLVVSGTTESIKQLTTKLKSMNVPYRQLEVACAFHSPLLAKSQEYFFNEIEHITFKKSNLSVWSNTTASIYPPTSEEIKQRLAEHLVKPVLFYQEIKNMYKDGVRIFIETGPGKILTQLVNNIIDKEHLSLHIEQKDTDAIQQLLYTIAQYMASGRSIKIEKLFEGRNANYIELKSPEKYKISQSSWKINGYLTHPVHGKLPSQGALPITQPLKIFKNQTPVLSFIQNNENNDRILLEYLANIKTIVQAQRDIVMAYLGVNPPQGTSLPDNILPIENINQLSPLSKDNITITNNTETETNKEFSNETIKNTLIEVVSEKTGYPREMLGMDLDLEADLSIDSIKRIEIIGVLKSKFSTIQNISGNDNDAIENLASLKTLKSLVDWITENSKNQHEDMHVLDSETITAKKASVHNIGSKEEIKAVLLEVVSEKTGYPQEMLGMDLDLEADLRIDSIKRIEIIGVLKSKICIRQGTNNNQEEIVEKLASIKTLTGLTDWIFNSSNIEVSKEPAKTEKVIQESEFKNNIYRLGIDLEPNIPKKDALTSIGLKDFAISNNGGILSDTLKNLLEINNSLVDVVSDNDNLDKYDGFIFLDVSSDLKKLSIFDLFNYLKKLNHKKVKWVYIISDYKSELKKTGNLHRIQGYSGLINSLNKEWDAKCRIIHIEQDIKAREAAKLVLDELLYTDDNPEVFYKKNERKIAKLVEVRLDYNRSNFDLNNNSTILAFGGAQGITSEILIHLSKEFPCHYILVGRSPNPMEKPEDEMVSILNKDEIRKLLLKNKTFSTVQELETEVVKIFKRNQIFYTIKSLEKNGSSVLYKSVDLKNKTALTTLIKDLYKKYGRIDGVIHGAGLLDDKFFHKKTLESFEKVYTTKVVPLRILAEELREDIRFIVLFSSIASITGNKGQADYAAANSVLDDYALELSNRFKGRVVAINWGPWSGKGMTSEAIEKQLQQRGVSSIPLDKGVEAFVKELKYGKENQIIIMSHVEASVMSSQI